MWTALNMLTINKKSGISPTKRFYYREVGWRLERIAAQNMQPWWAMSNFATTKESKFNREEKEIRVTVINRVLSGSEIDAEHESSPYRPSGFYFWLKSITIFTNTISLILCLIHGKNEIIRIIILVKWYHIFWIL